MLVVLAGSTLPAFAANDDASWLVQVGDGDRAVKNFTLGLTHGFDVPGSWLPSGLSFYGEAVVSQWFTHDRNPGARSDFTQFGLTPVARYTFSRGFFFEAGVGLDVITPRFHDGDRTFSTKFNFGDHVAVGARFGEAKANEISLRVEHFSNGGIRHPNPGQNFVELRYARHF